MPLLGPSLAGRSTFSQGSSPASFAEVIVKASKSTGDQLHELSQRIQSLEAELQARKSPGRSLPVEDSMDAARFVEVLFLEAEDNLGFEVEYESDGRAFISSVQPGTPLEQHGIRAGDRLLSCNGILSETLGGFVELAALLSIRPLLLQVSRGRGKSTEVMLKKTSTIQLQRLVTPSFFSNEPSIVDVLGSTSSIAKWVLFLGGFSMIENRKLHILYLVMFILSFSSCFFTCAANLYFQRPPYTAIGVDILTMYLHIFGLHTWLSWRRITRDPQLRGLVQRCLCRGHTSIRPDLLEGLCIHIRILSRIFAVVQIGAVALGYYALPSRSMDYWMEHLQGQTPTRAIHVFTVIHGAVMFLAIPSHVPTIVAAYGMLFLVCRLHVLDVRRFEHLMGGVNRKHPIKTDLQELLQLCVNLAIDMQEKLSATCNILQSLLLHQMAYVFMQLFTTGVQAKNYYKQALDSTFADEDWSGLVYTVWHLCLALLGLIAIAFAPAAVTAAFRQTREYVFRGLRARGADQRFSRLGAEDVAYSTVGFHCFGVELSPQFVSSFISVVFIGLALVIDLDS